MTSSKIKETIRKTGSARSRVFFFALGYLKEGEVGQKSGVRLSGKTGFSGLASFCPDWQEVYGEPAKGRVRALQLDHLLRKKSQNEEEGSPGRTQEVDPATKKK